jgi:hypothetical protein
MNRKKSEGMEEHSRLKRSGIRYIFRIHIFLLVRTYLEDQTLQKELPGYTGYTQKVTKKLSHASGESKKSIRL